MTEKKSKHPLLILEEKLAEYRVEYCKAKTANEKQQIEMLIRKSEYELLLSSIKASVQVLFRSHDELKQAIETKQQENEVQKETY